MFFSFGRGRALWRDAIGPVVVLLGIAIVENIYHSNPHLPEPAPLILVFTVMAGFLTTMNSAVLGSLIAVAYALFFVAERHPAEDGSLPICVEAMYLGIGAPILAIMGSAIRQNANRTANALQKHLSNTPLGVIELYSDYEVSLWAGSAETIFGIPSRQAIGKNLFDLPGVFFEDEDGQEIRRLLKVLERGIESKAVLQTRCESKDRGQAHSRWFWSSSLDAGLGRARFLVLVEDITERVKAEQEIERSKSEIIDRLVRATEHRDDDTGVHVVRMARYCEALAEAIGLPMDQCNLIRTAAPMHDIGKIGIPDDVLLKPGKLTPEEYEVIKSHTTIGAHVLSGSSHKLVRAAEVIALSHHERWDGTGYPKGLKGEEIPIFGRICAVCDIFDALTSARPYKAAWSVTDAVDELKGSSGTVLDPTMVNAFIEILPNIRSIMDEYQPAAIEDQQAA